ncbi:U1 small nuclear ribonucleoprotein C [Monosporozyma unispora]|nr:hypothetical protein C6P44_003491 [Kazachstania unispora]
MARYYCEYCHSYLTHDTLSVRKSHLIGKNHLRIISDYYRNKHVCSLQKSITKGKSKSKVKSKEKAATLSTDNKKITFHPLTNKEKRKNRKIKRIFDKELNNGENNKPQRNKRNVSSNYNNIAKQDNILSQLYNGSPGYSKIFIDSNRFDIGESIKQSRLPQRANDNIPNGASNNPVYGAKRDRNEVYENAEGTTLPPPLILSLWSNSIPKYQIYNNSASIPHENKPIYRDHKRRYVPVEDTMKYKKRRY